MNKKKILVPAFILVVLVQLYFPARMILDREVVLGTGVEFKFRAAPIDPSDPLRGKYITLNFDENTVDIQNDEDWVSGEEIYVLLTTGENGFAKIKSVSRKKPTNGGQFLKAKVNHILNNSKKMIIDYPFDRYYMEESKAYGAELTYRRSLADTNHVTYALVKVKNGVAALKDVMIDGTSIRDMIKAEQQNTK